MPKSTTPCPGCGSTGFFSSALGPGRCSFCDGTESGNFDVNSMPYIPTLATHYTLVYLPTDDRWAVDYFYRVKTTGGPDGALQADAWLHWTGPAGGWQHYPRGSGCSSFRHIPARESHRQAPGPLADAVDKAARRAERARKSGAAIAARGYRRVSNKHQLVARIDCSDWLERLATSMRRAPADFILRDGSGQHSPDWEAHYMRVYSRDQLEVRDREVFLHVPRAGSEPCGWVGAAPEGVRDADA